MTIYKELIGAGPLPPLASARDAGTAYPAFSAYPENVLEVVYETHQALREQPAKLSFALTTLKSALVSFGKGDGDGYKINTMSLRLFADHVRQIARTDL